MLGKAWFLNHHIEDRPVATDRGQAGARWKTPSSAAAQILANARYPIVYGLSDTTCEAQRVAVAIADRIGGCVDTTTSVCHGPRGMAFQGVGEVTCSLGEVKNRADLVIFWGSNPAESHPRRCGFVLHGDLRHQRAGTVYRMDDVPIPLRPAFRILLTPATRRCCEGIEKRSAELLAERDAPRRWNIHDSLKIANGTVYDPANNVNGLVQDIWIQDGKIVAAPTAPDVRPTRSSTRPAWSSWPAASICTPTSPGPKVNLARKMRPEDKRKRPMVRRTPITRSGTTGSVPSTFATGYLYAGMGYTTVFDAAIPPLSARHAHEEFHDTPIIDKGFFLLFGNNHYVLKQIADKEPERLQAFVGWLLHAAKGYAVKLVNPGGVEVWKEGGDNVHNLDDNVEHFDVTPRQIITSLAQTAMDLGLPHPVHIHCNNLGLPGNWKTTLATMQALEGRRAHLTHIQFHSYGGDPDDQGKFCSKVPELAEYVNAHPNLTRRRRPGPLRRNDLHDRRRPAGLFPAQGDRPQVDQRRHRDGGRLRHRAHHLQGEEPGPRPAMGDRPGVVSARQGPLADRHEHRPPQRRLVPRLPADRPAAHGPHLSAGGAEAGRSARAGALGPEGPRPRVHAAGDRHHHARAPGADAGPDAQGPPRRRVPTATSPSTRPPPTNRPCSSCRATSSRPAKLIVEQGEIRLERFGRTLHVATRYDEGVAARHPEVVRGVLHHSVRQLSGGRALHGPRGDRGAVPPLT